MKPTTISALNACRRIHLMVPEDVIDAFESTPRRKFVQESYQDASEQDNPLPIPKHQTISAPHMVMMMLSKEAANLFPGARVLEIGTGSGYNATLIAKIIGPEGELHTIERHKELTEFAKMNIYKIGDFENVHFHTSDGTVDIPGGYFDCIIVTASGPTIPKLYIRALKEHGRLVIPIRQGYSEELLIGLDYPDTSLKKFPERTKEIQKLIEDETLYYWKICDVRFVPLIGDEGF